MAEAAAAAAAAWASLDAVDTDAPWGTLWPQLSSLGWRQAHGAFRPPAVLACSPAATDEASMAACGRPAEGTAAANSKLGVRRYIRALRNRWD